MTVCEESLATDTKESLPANTGIRGSLGCALSDLVWCQILLRGISVYKQVYIEPIAGRKQLYDYTSTARADQIAYNETWKVVKLKLHFEGH